MSEKKVQPGFGALQYKGEGEAIIYDDPIFGNQKTYQPITKGLGYQITAEMLRHELYGQVDKFEKGLFRSIVEDQEVTASLLFNNGFVTTNANGFSATGFDALALFSTAHTRLDGGATQRNRPSTDVDFGVTGLSSAIIDFENWLDHRGRPALIRPKVVVVNPEDMFTAKEVLQSEYKPGTANNEINALQGMGLSYVISHYLTDNDQWVILGDEHDLNWIWDVQPQGGMFEDFDTGNIKRKAQQSYVCGHGEWYGTWSTTGA